MAKIITAALILIMALASPPALAAGAGVSSSDLIDNAKAYDGREVVYAGEVIGDIMVRDDHTWINVSDGDNAIGVWVKTADMQGITVPGRYDAKGDAVKVTGVFHRACSEHGGDFDIHAAKIELVKKGHAVTHPVDAAKVPVALILFAAAVGAGLIAYAKVNRAKK